MEGGENAKENAQKNLGRHGWEYYKIKSRLISRYPAWLTRYVLILFTKY